MRFSAIFLALSAATSTVLAAAPFPVGGELAGVSNSAGDTITFYQGRDGDLRQRAGKGPITGRGQYANTQLVAKGKFRANTPIAAIAYQGNIKDVCFSPLLSPILPSLS